MACDVLATSTREQARCLEDQGYCDEIRRCGREPGCLSRAQCLLECEAGSTACVACPGPTPPPEWPDNLLSDLEDGLCDRAGRCEEQESPEAPAPACTTDDDCCGESMCVSGRCTIACEASEVGECGDLGCGRIYVREGCFCSPFHVCVPCDDICDDGSECGISRCGTPCGGCGALEICDETAGACVACPPACSGRECGSDGCGGVCGLCGTGTTCDHASGQCEAACVPRCDGRVCGGDGCGGECGGCASDEYCLSGACEPVPPPAPSGANSCLEITWRLRTGPGGFCDPELNAWFTNNCSRTIECSVCPAYDASSYDPRYCHDSVYLTPGETEGGEWDGHWWCLDWTFTRWWHFACRFR
jgi:hypothetical protein